MKNLLLYIILSLVLVSCNHTSEMPSDEFYLMENDDISINEKGQTFSIDINIGTIITENTNNEILAKTINGINSEILSKTEDALSDFRNTIKPDSLVHGSLYAENTIITDSSDWYVCRYELDVSYASTMEQVLYYNINKRSGELAKLEDVCKEENYMTIINESIVETMREQMANDPSTTYWIDEKQDEGYSFLGISKNQQFYISEDNKLVVCFDKYEIAPGVMGPCEFVVNEITPVCTN